MPEPHPQPAGGLSLLEQIYLAHHRRLFYTALKLMGNQDDAEDALQETFLKISQNLDKIDDPTGNKTYAYSVTILKNTCVDALRQKARRRTEDLDGPEAAALSCGAELSVEERTELRLELEAAAASIRLLPDEYRLPLLLRYGLDLSEKETARRLGLTPRQVALRVFRAKKKLCRMARQTDKEV